MNAIIGTILAGVIVANPATAGTTIQQCQKHDAMMANLLEDFQEKPRDDVTTIITDGNNQPVGIVEMTVSPSGTVTYLTTDATGMTCIKSTGYLLNNGQPKLRGIDS